MRASGGRASVTWSFNKDFLSNPALGKQWSRDHVIDVPTTPTLPDANLRYQEALHLEGWDVQYNIIFCYLANTLLHKCNLCFYIVFNLMLCSICYLIYAI